MMCLACTDDKRLDRLLVYNILIDMVANSTYHADADHMYNTMADMSDSAFDAAAAVNNGLRSVKPAALVTVAAAVVVEPLALILEVVDIGTYVKILHSKEKGKKPVNFVSFI